MSDFVTKEQYEDALESYATAVIGDANAAVEQGRYDDIRSAVYEFAAEDITHHRWFVRSSYSLMDYAAIIEHSNVSADQIEDWSGRMVGSSPRDAIKRLAHATAEQDLTRRVLDRIET